MADSADSFSQITDDPDPQRQASDWAWTQICENRSPEEVSAELQSNGWSQEVADHIVEEVRRSTRHRRGVITRDDAARATGIADPGVIRRAMPDSTERGLLNGALGGVIAAIARLFSTKPKPRDPRSRL